MDSLIRARGLTYKDLQSIRELEEICNNHDNLSMKLNWDMLEKRSIDESNDFLYYVDDLLIGFVGLYGFGIQPKEIEITGMIHPDYRNRGVFKKLFEAAKQACETRGAEKILIIAERSSAAGIGFAKSAGSSYSFSEYRMKFDKVEVPGFQAHGITLRRAEPKDLSELINIDVECFESSEKEAENYYTDDIYESMFIAKLGGKSIGRIGILKEGSYRYIFGFGILPEYRGRGYGRAVLSLALMQILSEGIQPVFLEVEIKNENALMLYKSCGFKEVTVYDYYELKLGRGVLYETGIGNH